MIIQSSRGPYTVEFSPGIKATLPALQAQKPTHFLVDKNVYKFHKAALDQAIDGKPVFFFEANETNKSLIGVEQVATWLQETGANRKSVLTCFGGGITQDIAAFCAHIYFRGIKWVFYPTTLLSMSDSCIGAKSAINFNNHKNQLGMFDAPAAVFICNEFLQSLSDLDIASGYGEILKLHLTNQNEATLNDLAKAVQDGGLRNGRLLEFIQKSLEIKKVVIEKDEHEADLRRILNYGHTFGHALESLTDHEIPHGLAVAWGLDLINFIALRRKGLPPARFEQIHSFIKTHMPFKLTRKVTADALIIGIQKDKKAETTGVNLIFLKSDHQLHIEKVPFDQALHADVEAYLHEKNVYGA